MGQMFDGPVDVPEAFHVPSQMPPPVGNAFQRSSFSAYAPQDSEYLRSNSRTHQGQQLAGGAQHQSTITVNHPPGIHMSQRVPYGSQTTAATGMDYYLVPSSTQLPNQPNGRGTPNHQTYQHETNAFPGSSRLRPQQHVPLPSSSTILPEQAVVFLFGWVPRQKLE